MSEYFTVSYDPVDACSTTTNERMVYAERIRARRAGHWYDFGVVPTSHFKDSLLEWLSGTQTPTVGDRLLATGPTGNPPACEEHTSQPVFVPEAQAVSLVKEAMARCEIVVKEMVSAHESEEPKDD